MHNIQKIRDEPTYLDTALSKRGLPACSAKILTLDKAYRDSLLAAEELLAKRNKLSMQVGAAKKSGSNADDLILQVQEIKKEISALEVTSEEKKQARDSIMLGIPNAPASDVPAGKSEEDNQEIRLVGKAKNYAFKPLPHYDLGADLMDFEKAAELSGSRFVILKSKLSRLHRALVNFMLDIHINEHGYEEVSPPFLVRDNILEGTGQLPKFGDDLFRTQDDLWLIPTAEVPLTNLVRDQILTSDELPLRYTAWTPCFRREAGAAGRDTRGMLRQHQFEKVEMVSITDPSQSDDELERMTSCAETILQRLDLPYRVMLLCAGDMGFSARKTYDLEVWMPSQGVYREISSCSNCWDFQAIRMKARIKNAVTKKNQPVHTLNGSGVAVGRALIALMENHQDEDGTIQIPKALQSYMGGISSINMKN